MIDQNGYFSGGAYAIPREIRLFYGLEGPPTSHELRPGEVIDRVQRLVADVAAAPRRLTTDTPSVDELEPYENWRLRESGGTAAATRDAAIAGGMLGLLAGGAARLLAARKARTTPTARRRGRGRRRR